MNCCGIHSYSSLITEIQGWLAVINKETHLVDGAVSGSKGVLAWAVRALIDHDSAQNVLGLCLELKKRKPSIRKSKNKSPNRFEPIGIAVVVGEARAKTKV